jgi:hypothetical protein
VSGGVAIKPGRGAPWRARRAGGLVGMAIAVECWTLVNSRTCGSRSKYGFRASGVRTEASANCAESGLLPRLLSSVLKRPSRAARRELVSGERLSAVSASGQSTGRPPKRQETCHSARRQVRRRVRLVMELAERWKPAFNPLRSTFSERASFSVDGAHGQERCASLDAARHKQGGVSR